MAKLPDFNLLSFHDDHVTFIDPTSHRFTAEYDVRSQCI